jgi:sulfoxide reductase heme-binding subunit YedZ
MHLTSSSIDWYAARAGGVCAYVLLSLVVVLGLTMSGKKTLARWPRFALEDVHRFGGLLVGVFLFIHVATIAIDSYLPFSLTSLAVPLVAGYRPVWTALGIVALELLVALALTNRFRSRIPYRYWRRSHYLNFAVWAAAAAHGLGAGTDRSAPWFLAIEVASVSVVIGLLAWRILARQGALRRTVPYVASIAAGALVLGASLGPLHRVHHRVVDAAAFQDRLTGQIVSDNGATRGLVSFAGTGAGTQRVLVRADLLIAPNQLLSTAFQLEYLPSGMLCRGTVTRIHGSSFDASCKLGGGGARRLVHAQWQAVDASGIEGGVISTHA